MIKKMLVNATHPEENRVAIVEDGILSELDIEITGQEQTKGNIYKAVVVRVEPGLQAAFVDYGAERLGFLQSGELHPSLSPAQGDQENKHRPRINEILHRGQEILVQITKEERGNKGAALTTFLSLPGRYMVLMPEDDARGISRKIPDGPERKALRQAISAMNIPENMGIIVRTAAIGQTSEELQRDLDYLLRLYSNITNHAAQTKAPALIYQESNLVIRSIRDYFMPEMDEVLIDDPEVYNEARDFFTQVMPDYARLVKLHQEQRPIFSKYQIEEQIDTITQNQISMPSGGSIVIDQTEALVAIDVNSGKMSGEHGIEATAFKSNMEAASEVARQLRLRDLGGLVVIDFIDMRDRKNTREVEKRLKDALKNDKARVTVGRISQFGLLEMSRQRIKASLAARSWNSCPHCKGRGKVKSTEAQAVAIMRKIHAAVAKKQIERVEATVPAEVAEYLLNTRREELLDMERRYKTTIYLTGSIDLAAEEVEVEFIKREKRAEAKEESAPVTAAAAMAESAPAERVHQPVEAEAGEEPTQPHPPTKKKRSRRSKGAAAGADETTQATTEEQPADDQKLVAESATDDATEASETTEAAVPADEAAAEATRRPRRRRRRGRRGGDRAAADAATDATAETAETATETSGQDENTTVEPAAAPEEKPKPSRRRRGRKPASASQQEATPAETVETSPVKGQEVTSEPSTAEVPPTKPKRRRSPRKKATPVTQDIPAPKPAETPAVAPAVDPTDSPAAATEEKPKPRRRSRAKKETAPTEQPPATTTATEPVPVAAAQPTEKSQAAPNEKPKPSRSRARAKKAPLPVEPTAAAESTPPAEPKAAAKPRRKPATRKKPAPDKTETSALTAAPLASDGEKKKPKPRSRTPRAKKTAPETDTEA